MKSRILLKEIPYGKFHSAIFTTYSFNLYYFEQQVLPLLGGKGIHYISVLADATMLNNQFETFCSKSENRKRNYSVHGIQSNGAFHPKIVFLAGEASLLLLIGSGNLTTSGHGKNLESWNALYINDKDDPKFGFAVQCWEYLKVLHNDLGNTGRQNLKTVEENCTLLSRPESNEPLESYPISENTNISFLSTNSEMSIFDQLVDIIGENKINRITLMSPFYDSDGKLIQLFNRTYLPSEIHIILQKHFGAAPRNMTPSVNMHFHEWKDIRTEDIKQEFFHSKNFIFEGDSMNFLLTGSANASMAAFTSNTNNTINQEACILYQGSGINYSSMLALVLGKKNQNIFDYKNQVSSTPGELVETKKNIFIKAIEKSFETVTFYVSSKKNITRVKLNLYSVHNTIMFQKDFDLKKGATTFSVTIPPSLIILYGVFSLNNDQISNKQFVINVIAFESTNPSPKNRTLNQLRKLIEGGTFSTPKIIEYLSTIYRQKETRKLPKTSGSAKTEEEEKKEEENALLYMSYEEIQKRAKKLENVPKGRAFIEYRGVRLWESIYSYLKESKQNEEEARIDEEETEDINKSSGRKETTPKKDKKPIPKPNYERLKAKVEKFLSNYQSILESKIDNKKADNPSLIDLCMYLIILEILMHLYNHYEIVEDEIKDSHETKRLIPLNYSYTHYSWSECIIKFIGLFTLWTSQKLGFKEIEGEEYNLKLELFKTMAFKSSVSALALYDILNCHVENAAFDQWKKLCLLNTTICFNPKRKVFKDISEFEEYIPKDTIEIAGEYNVEESINENLQFILQNNSTSQNQTKNDFYLHPEDGITFVNKVISNPKNNHLIFLKLYNTGYQWDKEASNYWNGKLYSINQNKWLKAKKD